MKWIQYTLIALIGCSIGACKKDKNGATSVQINFSEPSIGDTIPSWNQVHMEGTISGNGEMNGYTISAINTSNNTVLYSKTYNVKSKAYNFHEHWSNNLYDTTRVTIKVDVRKNDKEEMETATRNVVCLP